ncbi:unnamed protein product [Ectocarpus sp. 13 AM-2016]
MRTLSLTVSCRLMQVGRRPSETGAERDRILGSGVAAIAPRGRTTMRDGGSSGYASAGSRASRASRSSSTRCEGVHNCRGGGGGGGVFFCFFFVVGGGGTKYSASGRFEATPNGSRMVGAGQPSFRADSRGRWGASPSRSSGGRYGGGGGARATGGRDSPRTLTLRQPRKVSASPKNNGRHRHPAEGARAIIDSPGRGTPGSGRSGNRAGAGGFLRLVRDSGNSSAATTSVSGRGEEDVTSGGLRRRRRPRDRWDDDDDDGDGDGACDSEVEQELHQREEEEGRQHRQGRGAGDDGHLRTEEEEEAITRPTRGGGTVRKGGERAGAGWGGLASSSGTGGLGVGGGSCSSSMRSSAASSATRLLRRVELRTPAEEEEAEAVRKSQELTLSYNAPMRESKGAACPSNYRHVNGSGGALLERTREGNDPDHHHPGVAVGGVRATERKGQEEGRRRAFFSASSSSSIQQQKEEPRLRGAASDAPAGVGQDPQEPPSLAGGGGGGEMEAGREISDIDRRLGELHEFLKRAKEGGGVGAGLPLPLPPPPPSEVCAEAATEASASSPGV